LNYISCLFCRTVFFFLGAERVFVSPLGLTFFRTRCRFRELRGNPLLFSLIRATEPYLDEYADYQVLRRC
jgi:hypothetical protein